MSVLIGLLVSLSYSIELELELVDSHPRLLWTSHAGESYEVQVSADLSPPGWATVDSVTAHSSTTTWTDPEPVLASRFYRIAWIDTGEIPSQGRFVHTSSNSGTLQDLESVSFPVARERLLQMASDGEVILPIPDPDIAFFDDIVLSALTLSISNSERTIVIVADATVRGQSVQTILLGLWGNDQDEATGFAFGVKFPQFEITDWASGLSGSVLGDLAFTNTVITLATADFDFDIESLPAAVADFYAGATLNVRRGLNLYCESDLATAQGLSDPLAWLGFSDTEVIVEGFLSGDVNALFHVSSPSPAILLKLRAHLPISDSHGYPSWIEPLSRTLEFTNDPAVRVQLLDTLLTTNGARFLAAATIDTSGAATSVSFDGQLAEPWEQPFGVPWLTLEQANLEIAFDASGAGEASLDGVFLAGSQTVSTDFLLTETQDGPIAAASAEVDELNLADILDLFSDLTGAEPFGGGLAEDALVFNNVRLSFESSDEHSLSLSADTTILDEIQAHALFSFVQPNDETSLLVLGLRVSGFRLSALYAGINGTFAGDLQFPGVAFTIVQDLPPDLPDPPQSPFTIPSTDLSEVARQFYQLSEGSTPFELELVLGGSFKGSFPLSTLPQAALDALGVNPAGEVMLEGAASMRVGALAGGGLLALDKLSLQATLPPTTQPRLGFPSWLQNLHPGPRTIHFDYIAPDVKVLVRDEFQVSLDGAMRGFVTSFAVTSGDQAQVIFTGEMQGGWNQPFGVDWLDLDTVGLEIAANAATASASLHSSFTLGSKSIALEMGISGNANEHLLSLKGSVDSLSLAEFTDLARKHLGAGADPFGDTSFNFTFTNVVLSLEAGTRSSFSIGANTVLNGTPVEALFSASYPQGGGPPQVFTGIMVSNWSLADSLDALKGTMVEDLRFETVALVFSRSDGATDSADMGPAAREFYENIFDTSEFSIPFSNGLSLLGRAPIAGNPLSNGFDALGMPVDSLFLAGTIPGSVIGLGGGGGGLDGLALLAALPPMSPPGSPEWFVSGQLALEITSQPSVGFIGQITTLIEDEVLTFSVSAAIQRVGASVEFALAGALDSEEPWEQPFGIEWLVFNNAAVKVAVNAIGSFTLGFAGDMVIGEKDIDVAVAATVNVSGVPTNFIFDGASEAGLEMADLVALQQAMARVDNPTAPMIPLETMPEMAVRSLHLKFAPRADPDLGVEAGFAIVGDLWLPSEIDGPPDRNFAGVELSVELSGIIAKGFLGEFEVGPIVWEDAILDMTLSLADQHLFVNGAANVGDLFQGDLDLGVTRTSLIFLTSTTLFEQFQAQIDASAAFSLTDPSFTVHALLENGFSDDIVPDLTQKVKLVANNSTSVADDILRRGLPNWTSFRNNPHSLSFASRITGFASAADWPSGDWQGYTLAIQDNMETIDFALPNRDDLLDVALAGITVPGIPGIKTTICVNRSLVPPFPCLEFQDLCNGFPYGGGPCWTIEPYLIPGACNDPSFSHYNIPCSSTPFIQQLIIPALIQRIDNILEASNRLPLVAVERAEFTAELDGLFNSPSVTLQTRVRLMQGGNSQSLSSTWNFDDRQSSLNALRDAVVDVL